ncbi:uncharacterized protein EV422DRAFT_106907 [Fimicolochytrium jonesii]|uniref:uncharacterized protein n=1 Tax=Fimicolochytrium jonesii TaxID=1396493 RepID=UPI0022FED4E7|nr:uncharacterized protein EV422DRAFT_106907 [Fimicolochytrium jonesii]KAI8819304.1 hypothetical protein EV422DRAFT_106907 [Fimicolochytrium jonesii]
MMKANPYVNLSKLDLTAYVGDINNRQKDIGESKRQRHGSLGQQGCAHLDMPRGRSTPTRASEFALKATPPPRARRSGYLPLKRSAEETSLLSVARRARSEPRGQRMLDALSPRDDLDMLEADMSPFAATPSRKSHSKDAGKSSTTSSALFADVWKTAPQAPSRFLDNIEIAFNSPGLNDVSSLDVTHLAWFGSEFGTSDEEDMHNTDGRCPSSDFSLLDHHFSSSPVLYEPPMAFPTSFDGFGTRSLDEFSLSTDDTAAKARHSETSEERTFGMGSAPAPLRKRKHAELSDKGVTKVVGAAGKENCSPRCNVSQAMRIKHNCDADEQTRSGNILASRTEGARQWSYKKAAGRPEGVKTTILSAPGPNALHLTESDPALRSASSSYLHGAAAISAPFHDLDIPWIDIIPVHDHEHHYHAYTPSSSSTLCDLPLDWPCTPPSCLTTPNTFHCSHTHQHVLQHAGMLCSSPLRPGFGLEAGGRDPFFGAERVKAFDLDI